MTRREPAPYPGLPDLGLTLGGLGLVVLGTHQVLSPWAPGIVAALLDLAAVLLELPQRLSDHGPVSWSRSR
jgi:hypothetical protein